MDESVHEYLDGEISRSDLGGGSEDAARRIERFVEVLREDASGLDDVNLAPAVMERIARSPSHAPVTRRAESTLVRAARWMVGERKVSFTLRPALVAAMIAVLSAITWWGLVPDPSGPSGASVGGVVAAESPSKVFVRFELTAPEARSVRLAGSFSNWSDDIELHRAADGRWVALVPLQPGVHDYAFWLDGERWVADPAAPRVADGFGGYNSRLSLVTVDS